MANIPITNGQRALISDELVLGNSEDYRLIGRVKDTTVVLLYDNDRIGFALYDAELRKKTVEKKAFERGNIDVFAPLSRSKPLENLFLFSRPIFDSQYVFVVKKRQAKEAAAMADPSGKTKTSESRVPRLPKDYYWQKFDNGLEVVVS